MIQNGKLVGAVTHVFVNDPTRGYGIFIENMLDAPLLRSSVFLDYSRFHNYTIVKSTRLGIYVMQTFWVGYGIHMDCTEQIP